MGPTRGYSSPNDSEEETAGSDVSDDPVCNGGSANKRKPARSRQSVRSKRQRVADDSDDDGSPQPSTSRVSNSVPAKNGEEESSGEETPDSDYMPVDDSSRHKRKTTRPPKGRPPKRVSPRKKKKDQNYSINSAKSQNGKHSLNHQNSSDKLSKLSQPSRDSVSFDQKHVESLAQKCVYFLLIEDQKKYAIRRKAIVTNVFKDETYSPKLYQAVIVKANAILMKTFAMELMELETQKDSYLLINVLKRELGVDEYVELSKTKHQQHGLILYLLTVIFMNNNCITEDELVKALQPLRLDLSSKKPHPVFGDVKNYITKELVKQMYLSYECISKEPLQYEIKWGLRAKEEVDKKDLLAFACKILDDTTPENWILQYKDAEESAGIHPT